MAGGAAWVMLFIHGSYDVPQPTSRSVESALRAAELDFIMCRKDNRNCPEW